MSFSEWFANWVSTDDGTPIEVTHELRGNVLSGYEWVPRDTPDTSKDYRPYGGPLL